MAKETYPQQVSDKEADILLRLLSDILSSKIPGDVVEFGCYKGDTSVLFQRLLQRDASERTLWLYDSFAGLPPRTKEDASVAGDAFKTGELFVTKREVVEKFKKAGLKVPRIKKAFFEDLLLAAQPTSTNLLPSHIAFAFLDGDLYSSIKTSFALVTPRLDRQGIIVVHDYNNPSLPGSARAVDEWLSAHPTFHLEVRETLAILQNLPYV